MGDFTDINNFYTITKIVDIFRLGKNALKKSLSVALKKKICLIPILVL